LIDRTLGQKKSSVNQAEADNYKQKKGLFAAQNDESACLHALNPLFFKREGRIIKKL
jgi:hypothetical protein